MLEAVAVSWANVEFVDLYVLRGRQETLEVLALRRAESGRSPGSWETIHGTIEEGETAVEAALRELREEAGLSAERLYNVSRVEAFFRHAVGRVAFIPVFAAFVDAALVPRLSPEHDLAVWLPPAEAAARFSWPRERRALEDVVALLGRGDGGLLEDALRVC